MKLKRPQTLNDLLARIGEKARLLPAPECYLWRAVWWHLFARESAIPSECIGFARKQLRLARDMIERPDHFRRKPIDVTDCQWSYVADLRHAAARRYVMPAKNPDVAANSNTDLDEQLRTVAEEMARP